MTPPGNGTSAMGQAGVPRSLGRVRSRGRTEGPHTGLFWDTYLGNPHNGSEGLSTALSSGPEVEDVISAQAHNIC